MAWLAHIKAPERVTASIGLGNIGASELKGLGVNHEPYCTGWHPLDQPLHWQGSEDDAMHGLPQALNPIWKVILLSDGSVTRHLRLMTGQDVKVECFEMKDLPGGASDLPSGVDEISGPLLQRQVFLRIPEASGEGNGDAGLSGTPLVYAASWWNAKEAREKLANEEQPIWTSLQGTELRREIQRVCLGNSPYLQRRFGEKGPFWGRQYVFYWDGGKPLTVIYEVFSPKLEAYLGPLEAQTL